MLDSEHAAMVGRRLDGVGVKKKDRDAAGLVQPLQTAKHHDVAQITSRTRRVACQAGRIRTAATMTSDRCSCVRLCTMIYVGVKRSATKGKPVSR